ncbi:MAG: 5-formyltetrahydrofolate cyclo-ligase [Methylobacteriaceae bacterium]|jgi:5-formyltetrahydrofolate cyclo-ligase|nr:5-formyltetrahydrofolate cyclo-ligase [Methylobacteriaceae bacterium]
MADSSLSVEKQLLRRAALQARDALAPAARDDASRRIVAHTAASGFFTRLTPADTVSAYWPIGSEVDPRPLFALIAETGAALVLPRLCGETLSFHVFRVGDTLEDGPFGLREPPDTAEIRAPDLILAPLVAFDSAFGRLGYGRGYFDRAVADVAATKRVHMVGLAFETQRVAHVPLERHDRLLDGVVTEAGVFQR